MMTVDRRTRSALWSFTGVLLGVLWILAGVTHSKAMVVVALIASMLAFPTIALLLRPTSS